MTDLSITPDVRRTAIGRADATRAREARDTAPAATSPLADLLPGVRARVVGVAVTGGDAIARRLEDLGFRPGAVVDVVRKAPLRDPVVYRVQDYEICLRRAQ